MGETQKELKNFLSVCDFNPNEDEVSFVDGEIVLKRRKAKAIIVGLRSDGEPIIPWLVRSGKEKTRQFEPDLPGGTLRLGEDPLTGAARETLSETGLVLRRSTVVAKVKRVRKIAHEIAPIVLKTKTFVVVSNAVCPHEGVSFGVNEYGDEEHCAAYGATIVEFSKIPGMRNKYVESAVSEKGSSAIDSRIDTAELLTIPEYLQLDDWQIAA